MLRAAVFDFDGVLVDSEPLHERAFLEVFAELGHAHDHGLRFSDYYGRSDRAVWVDYIARHQPGRTFEDLVAAKRARFAALLAEEKPVFAGLPRLLERLAPRYRLALASGSEHPVIDQVLALEPLGRYFKVKVSSEDVARGKPAPDIFLRAAEFLGVAPETCCVVEDSVAGVAGGRAAGMQVIGITNSLPAAALEAATQVVSDYAEIERLLLG
jgi:HAD superfamily hydrolase (TIGR01509 family)